MWFVLSQTLADICVFHWLADTSSPHVSLHDAFLNLLYSFRNLITFLRTVAISSTSFWILLTSHLNFSIQWSLGTVYCRFRVCEYIFKKHNLHDKILLTYVSDPARCHQAFAFIELTLTDKLNSGTHQKIVDVALEHLKVCGEIAALD